VPDYCAPAIIFAGGFAAALAAKPVLEWLWMRILEWAWRRERHAGYD
jgi:hypothetical protein